MFVLPSEFETFTFTKLTTWSVHFCVIVFNRVSNCQQCFQKDLVLSQIKIYLFFFFRYLNILWDVQWHYTVFHSCIEIVIRNKVAKPLSMPKFDTNHTTFACIPRLDRHSCELMLPIIPIVINVLWLCCLKFFWSFCGYNSFFIWQVLLRKGWLYPPWLPPGG